jgi:hypothetical protein
MVFSLAAISMAFAFRQQLQSMSQDQAPSSKNPSGRRIQYLEHDWAFVRGGGQEVGERSLWIEAYSILLSSQAVLDFSLECTYWEEGPVGNKDFTPGLLFRYQEPASTYQLVLKDRQVLSLEKRFEGETFLLAWVDVYGSEEGPIQITLEVEGGRVLTWVNDILVIDYTDHNPLSGDSIGFFTDSTDTYLRIDRFENNGSG